MTTYTAATLRPRIAQVFLATLLVSVVHAQPQTSSKPVAPSTSTVVISLHATGPFEVKIDPQPADEKAGGAAIGRMLLDKQFHGDLEATSKGTMLAAGTGAKNSSGGYVALEVVTGSLKGRTGTFVLLHSATMNRGVPHLSVTIVPDSGTGQLTGIAGTLTINIVDGKHSYDLEYTLPEAS